MILFALNHMGIKGFNHQNTQNTDINCFPHILLTYNTLLSQNLDNNIYRSTWHTLHAAKTVDDAM